MSRFLLFCVLASTWLAAGQSPEVFQPQDVFQLEYASNPQISPDGKKVVYVRNFMDVMTDKPLSNLWMVEADGSNHRPLTTGNQNDRSPQWSADGERLVYVSNQDGGSQIYMRWMDTGQTAKLTNLTQGPGNLSCSPDGKWIAFTQFVPEKQKPYVSLPGKPDGAKWADPAVVIDQLKYRADGAGYLKPGHSQIFILSTDGGSPRQLTSGPFNHGGSLSWSPMGKHLYFSANRHPDGEYDPANSEIYVVSIADGTIKALTTRQGPDSNPAVSPDGKHIAYLGYDDRYQGYQVTRLYIMNIDGNNARVLTSKLDRSVSRPIWGADGKGLFFSYSDHGNTKIAYATLDGQTSTLADQVGGTTLGRPYSSGSYSVSADGALAFTRSEPHYPADIAVGHKSHKRIKMATQLNEDLLGNKTLGKVEEIRYKSSFDNLEIQGWIVKPPHFKEGESYPLILEIHGGPFANYGPRFSAEAQLYASAGYVVLYTNPRGSTSYGETFGNLIHHNYPGQDYDDLMSGVDAIIDRGYINPERLYVTGGSGGGVLTSWIVGKTHRFSAAVVAKPVINWYSFVLTADSYNFFYKYWFPGFPWDHAEHYLKRSPLSLVGNVKTPTMLLTGEQDFRTPISESEQYYQALKLMKVDAMMVRIPGASHSIARRPSNLISKVLHILKWFDEHP